MKRYYVYIMSNQSRTLYIGMTSDLEFRVAQHKQRHIPGFTAKYNCTKLVYFEEFTEVTQAIEWEKKLKGWVRRKKIALIEERNPQWDDLAQDWGAECHVEGTPETSGAENQSNQILRGVPLRMTRTRVRLRGEA
jgi:putative endonuclease